MELVAPVVCVDRARHSCLVINVTPKKVFLVPMDAAGLELKELTREKFSQTYSPTTYPVGRAAKLFLQQAEFSPVADVVKRLLTPIAELPHDGLTTISSLDVSPAGPAAGMTTSTTGQEKDMVTKKASPKKPAAPKRAPAAKKAAAPKKTAEPKTPGRKPGVGTLITEGLLKGRGTEEILMDIAAKFPDSKSKASDVSWYRSKLKRDGRL